MSLTKGSWALEMRGQDLDGNDYVISFPDYDPEYLSFMLTYPSGAERYQSLIYQKNQSEISVAKVYRTNSSGMIKETDAEKNEPYDVRVKKIDAKGCLQKNRITLRDEVESEALSLCKQNMKRDCSIKGSGRVRLDATDYLHEMRCTWAAEANSR